MDPDFGPNKFNNSIKRSGAIAISARDFLVAYNINLNTTSTSRANAIAFDIREAGRIKRKGGDINGELIKDKNYYIYQAALKYDESKKTKFMLYNVDDFLHNIHSQMYPFTKIGYTWMQRRDL